MAQSNSVCLSIRYQKFLAATLIALWTTQSCLLGGISVVSASNETSKSIDNEALAEVQEAGPSYMVDLSQALTRYVTVTMTADTEGDETELMMPTWTPGSYLIREYAKHIDRIVARDLDGNSLKLEKISKNRWRVDTKNCKRFSVSYRLFCNEVSVRTNSVNFNRAVLNGAPTYLSIPQQHDRPHRIKLILPKNWSVSCSSMRRGRGEHNYLAENFDEVVDSPIVAGNVVVNEFDVAGVPHFMVNVGQSSDFDSKTAMEDLTRMVEEHHSLWGEIPYERYYFITVFGGGGGLEHDNCCLMMVPRLDIRDRANYRGWLNLASHEFFHTWNIRRLRPKVLVDYDYENEVYTPSLWIAEGLTSYYEDLLLVRAGLFDRDEFIQSLSRSIQQLQRTEGRLVQSLRDSSHDAWIKFYRPESNSASTQISYYTKGAIVSLLLDTRIRVATKGEKSLDDVLRLFWKKHKGDAGYLESDFREICNQLAGEDLSEWFGSTVDSTNELNYQEMADWYGLEIGMFKPQVENRSSGNKKDAEAEDPKEALNESTVERETAKVAENLRRWIGIGEFDSPATKAGLADTDEVIAVNDQRVVGSVEDKAQAFQIGEPVKVLVARNGQLQEILVVVGARPPAINWSLKIPTRTSRQQRLNLRKWISSSQPKSDGPADAKSDEAKAEDENDDDKDAKTSESPKKSKTIVKESNKQSESESAQENPTNSTTKKSGADASEDDKAEPDKEDSEDDESEDDESEEDGNSDDSKGDLSIPLL
jgi:predicted metalloprotease with PDZ domain